MYLNVLPYRYILGTRVDATNYHNATQTVVHWAQECQSRYVCAANVHMVMEAYDDVHFRRIVNSADMVTADGMPLVWTLNKTGIREATRVYGPDLMLSVCHAAEREGVPVGLYGGEPNYLKHLVEQLLAWHPRLNIVYSFAPPFRTVDYREDEKLVRQINASGARILFVGLGCPKQERWMLEHKGRVQSVMLGVGAAFDFHSGRVNQAPGWVQKLGMEWFYRFIQDPGRLWRRYFKHNPRFVVLLAMQLMGLRCYVNGKIHRLKRRF